MMYCCADSTHSPFQKVDIAFPYQVEIRVNQDEVKANLRGLKNKPGSTRPADITDLLRKRAGYENHLQITYALTNKVSLILLGNPRAVYPVSLLIIITEILCCRKPCETGTCQRACCCTKGR